MEDQQQQKKANQRKKKRDSSWKNKLGMASRHQIVLSKYATVAHKNDHVRQTGQFKSSITILKYRSSESFYISGEKRSRSRKKQSQKNLSIQTNFLVIDIGTI